jgi:hypothetical protein
LGGDFFLAIFQKTILEKEIFYSKRLSGECFLKLPKFTTRAYNMKGWSLRGFIFSQNLGKYSNG